MNEPHVVALIYTVEHDNSVDYKDAQALSYGEDPKFHLTVEDNCARFEFKAHYTDEDEARKAIEPFIQQWEFKTGLRSGPRRFNLRYREAEIKNRRSVGHTLSNIVAGASITLGLPHYPPPSSGNAVDPNNSDVKSMFDRYMNYRSGKRLGIGEPLPSLAYFCLTMLKYRIPGSGSKKTEATANEYHIDKKILDKIGCLTANKGDLSVLRKRERSCVVPLTGDEERFLENAVKKIIWRAAEVAAVGNQNLCMITCENLEDWKFLET